MPLSDYPRTTWQNGVTALNESNFNNIESGLDAVTDAVRTLETSGVTGGVASIADLRSLSTTGLVTGDTQSVAGYSTPGDGGGDVFVADATPDKAFTVDATGVTNNTITITAHGYYNGQPIKFYSITGAAGLNTTTTYYVKVWDANNIKVGTTYAGALAYDPSWVDITSTGSGFVNLADNGGTVIVPTANPSGFRWRRVLEDATITPKQFGAKGDNDYQNSIAGTDDTDALQRAAWYTTAAGAVLDLGNFQYRITASVEFGTGFDWTLRGDRATLTQYTTNTPVVIVNGMNASGYLIQGINFRHSGWQGYFAGAVIGPESYGIRWDVLQANGNTWYAGAYGTWAFAVRDCTFDMSYRGMGQNQNPANQYPIWSAEFTNNHGGIQLGGAMYYISDPGGGGQPNIAIKGGYIQRWNGSNPEVVMEPSIYLFNVNGGTVDAVEINDGFHTAYKFVSCSGVSFRGCRTERCKLATAWSALVDIRSSTMTVDAFECYTWDSTNTTDHTFVFLSYQSQLQIRSVVVRAVSNTGGAGQQLVLPWTASQVTLENYQIPSTVAPYHETISEVQDSLPYLKDDARWRLSRISVDRGDASVTMTHLEAEVQKFATALTANRTVTLPTAFQKAGLRHRFIRKSTATGPFTIDVGGLATLSEPGSWCEVQYNGTAWELTAFSASRLLTTNVQTGTTYTLALADGGIVVEMDNASANTLTVPPNSSVAFPIGRVIEVYQKGAGATTVAAGSGVTVRQAGALRAQYSSATLRKRATDEWVLAGDLA